MRLGDTELDAGVQRPAWNDDLHDAHFILEHPRLVTGSFFLEVYSGEGVFTMAMMEVLVPCIKPWDSRFGEQYDVLREGFILIQLASARRIGSAHLGSPCQSLTWARFPQLRSGRHPDGLPGLRPHQQQLVDIGNSLSMFTVQFCLALYVVSSFFSVENPDLSWFWVLKQVWALYVLSGVAFVRFRFREFGAAFNKTVLVLHNSPVLHELSRSLLPDGPLKIRGFCWWEGKVQH